MVNQAERTETWPDTTPDRPGERGHRGNAPDTELPCHRRILRFVAIPSRLPEDLLARVRDGERVELPEDGAAVVPIEDLRLLEAIEDAEDAAEVARRLADPKDLPVPYEDVRRLLGLA